MSVIELVVADQRFRSRYGSGTVSGGPNVPISVAPSDTTWGVPARPPASRRSGPALKIPPTTSSVSSVVVTSRTPLMKPERTSYSMARPPDPVAWKTSTS